MTYCSSESTLTRMEGLREKRTKRDLNWSERSPTWLPPHIGVVSEHT